MNANFILPGMDFVAKPGTLCLYSALDDIMKFYRYPITHTDLFFLDNGVDIAYRSNLNEIGYLRLEDILANLERSALIPMTVRYNRPRDELFAEAKEVVSHGHPVFIFIATRYLTYHPAFHEVNDENRGHGVVLYGFNPEEDQAYIGDAYFRDSKGQMVTYQGPVPGETVAKSVFGAVWFDPDPECPISKDTIVKNAVEHTKNFLVGRRKDEFYYGILALQQYVNDLPTLSSLDRETLTRTCYNIHYSLKVRSIIAINEYFIYFLHSPAYAPSTADQSLLDGFSKAKDSWDKVGYSIVKMGITGQKSSLSQIMELGESAIAKQIDAMEQFIEYYQPKQSGNLHRKLNA